MASVRGGVSSSLLRLVAVMLVGLTAGACSSIPSWVDPGTWLGPDVPDQASDGDNGSYPDLADIPEKPSQASTGEDRKKVADTLVAARDNVQYSAETLRGGTEASAAPPPAAPPQQQIAQEEESASQQPAEQEASSNSDDTASADQAAAPENESAPANAPAPAPTTQVATAQEPPVAAQPAVPAASAESALPSVPASPSSDAALGFQPSKAPPLDASVAQFVPQPIITRFAQTASVASPAVPDKDVKLKAPRGTRQAKLGAGGTDVGGPESMSGAVVADLGVLQAPSASETSVYTNTAGMPAAEVVFFPGDITSLNAEGRHAVRAAVAAFRARGGQSYIRVVGHSSSRTANMPVLKHLELIFRKSQERASAVARELIHEGVPADRILIDAVGDSQPVYYESMPKGEDGNRRAEIFIEG